MRAFVTGGSGYVGRNLIRQLLERGDTVCALVRSEQNAKLVRALGASPVLGDLGSGDILAQGLSGCDVVFHAAAQVAEWGDRRLFHKVNVEGTRDLLAAVRAAGTPKFVHVSTEAVLADGGPLHNADESWPRPAKPLPRYPATKAESEQLVLAASNSALQTVAVRPRLIWGNDDTSLLPGFMDAVHKGRFAWINGGRFMTSTTHVDNVCEGLLLAAEKGRGGEVYFVTDGPPVEFREFLTAMLATQGVDPGNKKLAYPLARAIALAGEWVWNTFSLRGAPPLSRLALWLLSQEVTINDAKARSELGYVGKVQREAGLASIKQLAEPEH